MAWPVMTAEVIAKRIKIRPAQEILVIVPLGKNGRRWMTLEPVKTFLHRLSSMNSIQEAVPGRIFALR